MTSSDSVPLLRAEAPRMSSIGKEGSIALPGGLGEGCI